ncbi:hypothetical protein DMV94_20165 [Vibrio parahaemolyticus]|uniref:hypothetical protein n=1 Tax=Vibrio parahaemolyticus TaxID=670 RepID=UPI0003592224|nr:hypothetical protein [Vibrio parahaemolyticus]AGR00407.1 hypothetical protein M636_22615 [Vibrio parahaemolyticus O1:K33 str. CDC_K4557]EGR2844747.1 hypothetical protein [Vibrio parahaemolyticus]EGR3042293.1 hypothetical protein [Vibrio parahaemolyticus]ODY83413.1 hypothetical protein BBM30_10510 [Vibrio parahaemolyticus]TPA05087.1 hypothetical protein DXE03_22510 [Vibrio parahaemolyticus]
MVNLSILLIGFLFSDNDVLLIEWLVDLAELSVFQLMDDYTSQLSLSALFSLFSQSNSDGLKIVH